MDADDSAISPHQLLEARAGHTAPLLIDVRREAAFRAAPDLAAGALRRDPATVDAWAGQLPANARIAVYCVHGHEVSQNVAAALRRRGHAAHYIAGGIEEGLRAAGCTMLPKPAAAATRWITRERPKVDRIACPWLITRFIDPDAEFLYAPPAEVGARAQSERAITYDVADGIYTHDGPRCSFDALISAYCLTDPALLQLADIVRGADTGHPEIAPQSAGLLTLSVGLSHLISDDHAQLQQGMVLYDALYLACAEGRDAGGGWQPVTRH